MYSDSLSSNTTSPIPLFPFRSKNLPSNEQYLSPKAIFPYFITNNFNYPLFECRVFRYLRNDFLIPKMKNEQYLSPKAIFPYFFTNNFNYPLSEYRVFRYLRNYLSYSKDEEKIPLQSIYKPSSLEASILHPKIVEKVPFATTRMGLIPHKILHRKSQSISPVPVFSAKYYPYYFYRQV